jgi:alpha-tubulin suppressor-like RCC1 family protein
MDFAIYIDGNNSLYSSGSDYRGYGLLGLGSIRFQYIPALVTSKYNVTEISTGFYHTLFLTNDSWIGSFGYGGVIFF